QGSATAVHVAVNDEYAGTVLLADTIRDGAQAAVTELHRRGLRTMIITGDEEPTAHAVAAEIGIDDVRAGLLPEEKLAAIDAERATGRKLAMVGDGVNDAPALARAQVGGARGSGTDIAPGCSDVGLTRAELADRASAAHRARR